jgi:hypothetical protein
MLINLPVKSLKFPINAVLNVYDFNNFNTLVSIVAVFVYVYVCICRRLL